jgi:hypothetical protein
MMSEKEFTPTWEEVRGAYVAYNSNRDGVSGVEAKAEFSRYWGEQIQRGREAERESIIQLLENYKELLYDDANDASDPAWDIERGEAVERSIALIRQRKGEN